MTDPIFLDSYEKNSIFLTSGYMLIFFAQRFFEAARSLSMQWIDCDICLITSKNGYENSKGSIWIGEHLDDQVYEWVRFFKGQVYKRGRFAQPYHNYPLPSFPSPPTHPHPSPNTHTHTYTHTHTHRRRTCSGGFLMIFLEYSLPVIHREYRLSKNIHCGYSLESHRRF